MLNKQKNATADAEKKTEELKAQLGVYRSKEFDITKATDVVKEEYSSKLRAAEVDFSCRLQKLEAEKEHTVATATQLEQSSKILAIKSSTLEKELADRTHNEKTLQLTISSLENSVAEQVRFFTIQFWLMN